MLVILAAALGCIAGAVMLIMSQFRFAQIMRAMGVQLSSLSQAEAMKMRMRGDLLRLLRAYPRKTGDRKGLLIYYVLSWGGTALFLVGGYIVATRLFPIPPRS